MLKPSLTSALTFIIDDAQVHGNSPDLNTQGNVGHLIEADTKVKGATRTPDDELREDR